MNTLVRLGTSMGILLAALLGSSADSTVDVRMAAFESGLRPAFVAAGEEPQRWNLAERMAYYQVPGVSVAVIEDGRVVWARGYGVRRAGGDQRVDTGTVFSVGSVSKMGTAALVLRLVADGRLELDRDLNEYLGAWQIPPGAFTAISPVTLRGVLSHTAGLNVHGFPDFQPDEPLPSVLDVLRGVRPAKTPSVRAVYVPGSSSRYSGGGTTVLQLLVEELTGQSFDEVADRFLFSPLGMSRSTYRNPLPGGFGNIAHAHDRNGVPVAQPRGFESFPEAAASGLWTTPTDLANLTVALLASYRGASGAFLPKGLAHDAMTEVGMSYFGLGPQLTGDGMHRRFFHGGSNESYKAWLEGHLEQGSGFVIATNGANGSQLYMEIRRALADAYEWPFYRPIIVPESASTNASMDRFVGHYRIGVALSESQQRLRVVRPIERLHVTSTSAGLQMTTPGLDDRPRRLVQIGPTQFVIDSEYAATPSMLRAEFICSTNGQVEGLMLYRDKYSLVAYRFEPDAPAPDRH